MSLRLQARPASVRIARHWVARRARDCGGSRATVAALELVTSELVTNAVKYGPPGGVIEVDTEHTGDLFDVIVRDDSHEPPVRREDGPGQAGGHGVRLAQTLATQWGVELHEGNGKSVRFSLPV